MTKLSFSILALMATIAITSTYPYRYRHGHHWRSRSRLIRPRVYGGVSVEPNEFPFLVEILENGQHLCGGSLVADDVVLTAAHCVHFNAPPSNYVVMAGEHNNLVKEGPEQRRFVWNYTIHEDYGLDGNDMALLVVDREFKMTQEVSKVALPPPGFIPTNKAVAMGWGRLKGGAIFPLPLKVTVPFVDAKTCELAYGGKLLGVICYGGIVDQGTCNGDSGGPLMCGEVQCGVASQRHLSGCGVGIPEIYVEVAQYLDWITTTIENIGRPMKP